MMPTYRRALREGWNVTPEMRKTVLEEAMAVLNSNVDPSRKMTAARVLIAADLVDIKAEAVDQQAATAGALEARALIQKLLSNPTLRKALLAMDDVKEHPLLADAEKVDEPAEDA